MDSKESATSCSVCQEIYTDPRSLACGHTFCLQCLKGVAGNKQKFQCPLCRFDVDLRYTNIDKLPKNFVLCNVIEAIDKKHQSMCLDHNKSLDLFCQRCDVVICLKCLTTQHKRHDVEDIKIIYSERNKQLEAFLERTKQLASMTQEKSDAVEKSRILMENNIDSISKTVKNTFKKWTDALQKQHNAIVSYLHQERDQNRQMFVEAERILAGSMTTVTGLDTEINNLRSKDTAFVVQQYGSIKARQEDTECKILQEIETCFTPPDNLAIEVYAPWIEEAINNIKHIDMKQTKAKPVRQTIAEIQEENVILKREAEYASNLLEQLNDFATNEGKDRQVILKEPVIPMAHDSRKHARKDNKKRNDQQPRSRHVEQLQRNFSSASKVLNKQMDAENAVQERECLLLALDCLFKHSQDLSEGMTGDISSTLDQIKSFINKESPANQGLSHAGAILNINMEWKREAEYASNLLEQLNDFATNDGKDRQVTLKEPVIPMAHDSRTDGKIKNKKHTDQSPRSRHVEQLQRNFSSASKVLKKQMDAENAVQERECLLLALDCLFKHSQDLSEGTTGDISSTLDQIKSFINKESPANQGLSHAGAILNIHMEWKREVEYVADLLEELAKVSQSTNNGDNSIILSHPENFGSSRDYKTKDGKKTESSRNKPMKSVQNEKLMRHYGNASYILKQMKENDILRIDLGKRTEQVQDLMARLKKLQGENIEIKKDADSLRTRLSEHTGALLTFENRSVSNLSDPNRPTKLAEMYLELYDNKWTDAFTNLAKEDPDISEKKLIGYLYDMLVDGYRFCEDVRQTQKSSLEDILFYPAGGMYTSQRRQKEEISTIFANHLSDVAKLSSTKSSADVAKAFVMDEKTKDKYSKMIKLCERYIQECVQLCWLMQVQTPPLCLDLKTIQGQTFDKNCYREYTKKGKKIAFVVWPALFLHDNGPVLSKGVAQCESRRNPIARNYLETTN